MPHLETDYLVVGAGASALAFTDALIRAGDPEVLLVDRRNRPGGHWLDAYPFVRLHQPSANYGVMSRRLGGDRIDTDGPNAGFYERATAAEVCDYFGRVLDEDLLPSGRVSFLGLHQYLGEDQEGHHLVSVLTGAHTTVRVRHKVVDATYVESEVPSRHRPGFGVDPDVRFVAPNALVDLDSPAARFTVVGAGKTAMDTCNWLLQEGVRPDSIRWVRPRDPWLFDRTFMQPLELVGSYMDMQARWVQAAAEAESGLDFARRLEESGVWVRIDPSVEPEAFRGAIVSQRELQSLRSIENVVRARVLGISRTRLTLEDGELPGGPDEVYVDCTAAGVRALVPRPVFEPRLITLEYVTVGIVPWSAANVGRVEATGRDDAEKNRLCPPVVFSGSVSDVLRLVYSGLSGASARTRDPELGPWNEACRLNPASGILGRLEEPGISASLAQLLQNAGPAFRNLRRRLAEVAA